MPDPIFAEPRLAAVYDAFDGERSDLDVYAAIVDELGGRRVLDIGCGTGAFACKLALLGFELTAIDPALASLEVARRKPGADRVNWLLGAATELPAVGADVAVMTGNVAQVFLTDVEWMATLRAARAALRPGGSLVFEVRDPARRAWEGWTPQATRKRMSVPGAGRVEASTEVTELALPLVSFRHTYVFESDGAMLTSDSTLRFRERAEVEGDLVRAGFAVSEVRDAPDRPGLEFVFIAARSEDPQ